jgi:hypothetical protein
VNERALPNKPVPLLVGVRAGLIREDAMVNRQRVVILGSLGMAGHMILRYLSGLAEYEAVGLARTQDARFVDRQVDVENLGDVPDLRWT